MHRVALALALVATDAFVRPTARMPSPSGLRAEVAEGLTAEDVSKLTSARPAPEVRAT